MKKFSIILLVILVLIIAILILIPKDSYIEHGLSKKGVKRTYFGVEYDSGIVGGFVKKMYWIGWVRVGVF